MRWIFWDPFANLYRSAMYLDQQIKEVCQQVISCESDEKAVELLRRLQGLLHQKVEELRATFDGAATRD
jgi:hypothetical protein